MKHPIRGGVYDDFGLEFETAGDPAEAAAGGDPAPAPAPAPAGGDPAGGWAGPSQEEWQDTQQFLGFIANALQEPDPVSGEPAPPAAGDEPLTAAAVQAMIDERAAAIASEQVGAYAPILNEIAAERGKALVKTELETLMADPTIGTFKGTDHATAIAQGLLASGIPAEQALRTAAIQQAAFEKELLGAGAQGERQQIANRLGQTPEPGTTEAAVHEIKPRPARDDQGRDRYQQIAHEWEESRRARGASPVG